MANRIIVASLAILFLVLVLLSIFINPSKGKVNRMTEAASGSSMQLAKKNGAEYHIGSSYFNYPNLHFEVLTKVGNKIRAYEWKVTMDEIKPAYNVLKDAIDRSLRDSAQKSYDQVGKYILWTNTDASQWIHINNVFGSIMVSDPILIKQL